MTEDGPFATGFPTPEEFMRMSDEQREVLMDQMRREFTRLRPDQPLMGFKIADPEKKKDKKRSGNKKKTHNKKS